MSVSYSATSADQDFEDTSLTVDEFVRQEALRSPPTMKSSIPDDISLDFAKLSVSSRNKHKQLSDTSSLKDNRSSLDRARHHDKTAYQGSATNSPSSGEKSQHNRWSSSNSIPHLSALDESQSTFGTVLQEDPILIEVERGVTSPLTGNSANTWRAIQLGKAREVSCWVCQAALFCMAECEYVLCPDCRVLSPNESYIDSKPSATPKFGVGLGVHTSQCM